MSNKLNLPWEVWDSHVTCSEDPTHDNVAFNVGRERAEFIVKAANEHEWLKGRIAVLEDTILRLVKCKCGSSIPETRIMYHTPTCYKCLPPPPPLDTYEEIEESDIIEETNV